MSEVKKAKFYSVIANETADVANKEQLSISLRYILNDQVNEVFLDFVEVERITGEVLANSIIHSQSWASLSQIYEASVMTVPQTWLELGQDVHVSL